MDDDGFACCCRCCRVTLRLLERTIREMRVTKRANAAVLPMATPAVAPAERPRLRGART